MAAPSQPRPRRPLALQALRDTAYIYETIVHANQRAIDGDEAGALAALAYVAPFVSSHRPVVLSIALAIEKAAETAVPSTLGPWRRVPALKPVPKYEPANDDLSAPEKPGPVVA